MKLRLLLLTTLLALSSSPVIAQVVATSRARPALEMLDSLRAGRQRWESARVIEYQLQSHVSCFCVYTREDLHNPLPLLTIRNQSIIARAKGTQITPPSPEFTIEGLFAKIEEDARSNGRIIDRLDLHPVYGFPVWYHAHDPEIPDDWLRVQVDSFAVIRRH